MKHNMKPFIKVNLKANYPSFTQVPVGQESPIYLGPDVSMSQSGEIADHRGGLLTSLRGLRFQGASASAGRDACSLPGCWRYRHDTMRSHCNRASVHSVGKKVDNYQLYALIQSWKMESDYHTSWAGTLSDSCRGWVTMNSRLPREWPLIAPGGRQRAYSTPSLHVLAASTGSGETVNSWQDVTAPRKP